MNQAFVPVVTFFAVIFSVIGVYSLAMDLFLRDRTKVKERLDEELRDRQRARAKQSLLKNLSGKEINAMISTVEEKRNFREKIAELIDQAGLLISPAKLGQYTLASTAICSVLALIIRGNLIVAAIGAVIGSVLPIWYVRRLKNNRQAGLRHQLADSFELMSSTLRAGQSMAQAMQAVAIDFPPPISEEFLLCFEQQNLGLDPEIALRQLARRTGMLELRIFVVAVLVQRQVGGNLSEILQGLAHVVRERFRTQALIQTLTAEGRLQAVILMALSPFLLLVMIFMNGEYMQSLVDSPMLIVAMAVLQGIGWLWIRKIVNFDF